MVRLLFLVLFSLSLNVAHASNSSVQSEWRGRIQDWSDDRALMLKKRNLACGMAGITEAAALTFSPLFLVVTTLQDLPSTWASMKSDLDAEAVVGLTSEEKRKLQDLRASALPWDSSIIVDQADRLRILIQLQIEIMKIMSRLYDAKIVAHFEATQQGVGGFLKANLELCLGFSLIVEKDEQLVRAAGRVLAYYDFLEQELSK